MSSERDETGTVVEIQRDPSTQEVTLIGKAATSGKPLHRTWRIPLETIIDAIDRRMQVADAKPNGGYTIHNWKQGLDNPKFIRDRVGHLQRHLARLMEGSIRGGDSMQDNADAVQWGAMFVSEGIRQFPEVWAKTFYPDCRDEKGGL